MGYVFISYSNKQESFALALNDILNSNGIQTWRDKGNIPPGSKYAVELMRAIKNCSCFVLLVTCDSMNSEWVDKEVERAIHYKKPVFPVKLDDTELNEQFELYLSTYQIIRVDRIDSKSSEIRQLVSAISRCVQDRPEPKSVVSTSGSSDPARSKRQRVSGKIDWAASLQAKENPYRRYTSELDTEEAARYVATFTPKKKELWMNIPD